MIARFPGQFCSRTGAPLIPGESEIEIDPTLKGPKGGNRYMLVGEARNNPRNARGRFTAQRNPAAPMDVNAYMAQTGALLVPLATLLPALLEIAERSARSKDAAASKTISHVHAVINSVHDLWAGVRNTLVAVADKVKSANSDFSEDFKFVQEAVTCVNDLLPLLAGHNRQPPGRRSSDAGGTTTTFSALVDEAISVLRLPVGQCLIAISKRRGPDFTTMLSAVPDALDSYIRVIEVVSYALSGEMMRHYPGWEPQDYYADGITVEDAREEVRLFVGNPRFRV